MKKKISFSIIFSFVLSSTIYAQTYKDDFSNDVGAPVASYWGAAPSGITVTHIAGSSTTTITGNGTSGTFQSISYTPYDNPEMGGTGSALSAVDMSGLHQDSIFVIAKSTVAGTKLRIDIKDANDYVANAGTITSELALTTSYAVYKFVYTTPNDGAYGGTGCATGPCTVDKATIKEFLFYANAVNGLFNGTIQIDYFQVGGTAPAAIVTANHSAVNNLKDTKLYPNPSVDEATVDFSLATVSTVKVTLTNLIGKQVDALEATTADFKGTFNTSNLTKGIYTVNYFINNELSKAELLLVK
jgi:hypothetical protein